MEKRIVLVCCDFCFVVGSGGFKEHDWYNQHVVCGGGVGCIECGDYQMDGGEIPELFVLEGDIIIF